MRLTIDVETVPTTNPVVLEEVRANIKPPGQMSKEETIRKWWFENGDAALDEAIRKTAVDILFAEIITVAFSIEGDNLIIIQRDDEMTEAMLLQTLVQQLSAAIRRWGKVPKFTKVIGYNHLGFDLPLLHNRAAIHGLRLPMLPRNAKPWDDTVADIMLMLGGSNYNCIKMDKACLAFGIPGKGDVINGANVYDHWLAGDYDTIGEYCGDDVCRTWELYKRII